MVYWADFIPIFINLGDQAQTALEHNAYSLNGHDKLQQNNHKQQRKGVR